MERKKRCACSIKNTDKPEDPKTGTTLVTPDDLDKTGKKTDAKVSDESVEESVVMINPDADSMNSRG